MMTQTYRDESSMSSCWWKSVLWISHEYD